MNGRSTTATGWAMALRSNGQRISSRSGSVGTSEMQLRHGPERNAQLHPQGLL